jgi:hypothetical protein
MQQKRRIKKNELALATLMDIDLAIIPPELSFEEIIEYRHDNEKELDQVRQELGNLARTIKETPWSEEFRTKLEEDIIPNKIYPQIKSSKQVRDSWLNKHKKDIVQVGTSAATIGVTAALTVTTGVPLPIPQLINSGGTISSSTIDLLEEQDFQNDFHYLMRIKQKTI